MDGITAAVIGALAGAVIVIATRTITDVYTMILATGTIAILIYYKKVQEPYIIAAAALLGLIIKSNFQV